jgi:serine/threonine protein kinase
VSDAAKELSDQALARLRGVLDQPDLSGTRYELVESIGRDGEEPSRRGDPSHSGCGAVAPLGRGGFSVVWRARDRVLERDVALKVLSTPAAAGVAERLVAEAKILARLDHPGIVPVHDAGTLEDGRVFYAMKLVNGRRLDQLARAGASEADLLRILVRVGEAVAFAHAQGVVHCDLKPANVMVGAFGEVLVMDWGVAKVVAQSASGEPSRVGTAGFMSPEQERGDLASVDAQSDVFALGAMLKSLIGARPPRALAAIAAKAMQSEKSARYASALDFNADIERYRSGEAVLALPEGIGLKLARIYRQNRAAFWIVATYMVARTAFAIWQFRGRGS